MNLEEAKQKYMIDVPTDEIFYSKEYINYFNGENKKINLDLEKFRKFQEMYVKSFIVTFGEHKEFSVRDRIAIVLGGQTGAGKSGLVNLTNREGILTNRSFYLIDDDQFRKFYPRYDEIMAECPEFSTILTAMGSGPITPKIMKYASDNGLNFIFDGTMKNTRIFKTAQQWKDYDVTYRVMATSRMESLLSIFERNAFLRRNGFGRPIGVKEHDATYEGLENTLKTVEDAGETVEVYVRGRTISCIPELIYSSKRKGLYKSSVEALRDGRTRDKKFCINNDVQGRIANLETSDIGLNSVECKSLCELKEALEEEMAAER